MLGVAGNCIVIAGEAKWTREPIGFGVLNHPGDVLHHVRDVDNETQLGLFGRRFETRLKAAAHDARARLVGPSDLYA